MTIKHKKSKNPLTNIGRNIWTTKRRTGIKEAFQKMSSVSYNDLVREKNLTSRTFINPHLPTHKILVGN